MMHRGRRSWNLWSFLVLVGCGGADSQSTEGEEIQAPSELPRAEVPTLEEFVESVHERIPVGDSEVDVYVLEGDMIVPYEMVVEYYEAVYLPVQEKGVGVTVPGGPRQAPRLVKRTFSPITYCIDDTFTAAQRTAVAAALNTARAAWAAASSGIKWFHAINVDGATCASEPLKDFRVTKATSVAEASFPGETTQLMRLPLDQQGRPPGADTILHELGHILGLGHEQFHTLAQIPGGRCTVFLPNLSGAAYKNLTASWDAQSVMQNRGANGIVACQNASAGPTFLSAGDKVSARVLYGP